MKKKVLILGSNGMLGHMVVNYLEEYNVDVTGISLSESNNENFFKIDITDIYAFNKFISERNFDFIINCAAMLVKSSGSSPKQAIFLNSFFPKWLEKRMSNSDTRIVQVSTDGIFAGKKNEYDINDLPEHPNFYSVSKFLGELDNNKDLTVRSAFWGPDPNESKLSLFNWIFTQEEVVYGYNNVFFNGISNLSFAKFIYNYIQAPYNGIIHIGLKAPLSKYELIKNVVNVFNLNLIVKKNPEVISNNTLKLSLDNKAFIPISIEETLQDIKTWIYSHKNLYEKSLRR